MLSLFSIVYQQMHCSVLIIMLLNIRLLFQYYYLYAISRFDVMSHSYDWCYGSVIFGSRTQMDEKIEECVWTFKWHVALK